MDAEAVGNAIRGLMEWTTSASPVLVLVVYGAVILVIGAVILGAQKLWDHLRNGGAGRSRLTNDPRRDEIENRPTRRR